ncbi:kinase-like domain-containing protein, partial [Melanogaster broomeanus]
RELGIWRRLEHDNIVPFLGIVYGFSRHDYASLVSLWMPNGTLQRFLAEQDGKLTVTRQLQLMIDETWTVHSIPLIHGDLNCNNVLLDANFNARLADFGYASVIGQTSEALAYLQMSTIRPGAIRWAAPEQISQDTEEKVLSGQQPWSEVQREHTVIVLLSRGQNPGRPQSRPIADQHWKFIERCWENIQERPPASHIV